MRHTQFMILASALLVAGLQTQVAAQPFAGLKDRLGLTDDQMTRLEQLQQTHQTAAQAAQAEMVKAQAEVQSLMMAPERDMRALETAIRKLNELQTTQQIEALKHQEAYKQVLTAEQREKLTALGEIGRAFAGRAVMGGRMGGRAMAGRGWSAMGLRGRAGMRGRTFGRPGRMMRTPRRGGWGVPPAAGQGFGTGQQGRMMMPGQMMRSRIRPPGAQVTPPPPPPIG